MNKENYRRRSIRLPTYDYSQEGWYFVTICIGNREMCLGNIDRGTMKLSQIGRIVQNHWLQIPEHFRNIKLDGYIIMPNHIHGIIVIHNYCRGLIYQTLCEEHQEIDGRDKSRPYIIPNNPMKIKRSTLGQIIRYFKGKTTYDIHKNGFPHFQWQRNYYEHVIRNEESLDKIREYILKNPENWEHDRNNLINISSK